MSSLRDIVDLTGGHGFRPLKDVGCCHAFHYFLLLARCMNFETADRPGAYPIAGRTAAIDRSDAKQWHGDTTSAILRSDEDT
jgi:hypothetical protein